ncbi:hypothetical protein SAMD00019534_050800 [Acytostelium subglobosum LB1]|uniref:hypothetical protein n=1 Tax=Acytostelium subglobosum LB1 TaxID=1410327 RepID=UPI0006448196|nr:hypothetical protein SAMD00019534_050800 [Acytostelium subglobosum LB1]GAM21905.1 hypothetical protein SAMD00019534_050800 [Acytostelium subglobosum LB1]|eukprot:XP_012755005.1 hypothetical protein SAMD00019534_050800 [Acytostelium subglobosum LB1]
MRLLWSTLQELATTHQTLSESAKSVTESFKQLHDMLIIEEHKITSPILDRVQQAATTMHNIINEIKMINSVFRPSTCTLDRKDIDMELDKVLNQLHHAHHLISSSLDQFIEQTFPIQHSDDAISITDMEVLTLLQRTIEKMNSSHHQLVRRCTLHVDTRTLDSIKDQIRTCYQLLEEENTSYTHGHEGQIMCMSGDSYSIFTPVTDKWSNVIQEKINEIIQVCSSAVYARGNIYVFVMPT